MSEFVHLHVHSQYSMLDGAIRLKPLVEQVKAAGMGAVALTDHANMFGALQFTKACKEAGIKPILGCEVNLVMGDRRDPTPRPVHHLVLLVASQDGYKNLVRLVSRGWVEGLANGVARIDLGLLREHARGLVGLSGCMAGYAAQEVLQRGPAAGRDALALLRDAFEPGTFYVELQDHGFPEQTPLNQILVELARELALPIVATNDCHYHARKDAGAQLVLQCIAAARMLEEMERTHHRSSELYVKTAEEMAERFRELPEALRATLEIAERCAGAANPMADPMLPKFQVPADMDEETYFRQLAREGLDARFEEHAAISGPLDETIYRDRLDKELDVIAKMGFAGYFLIVQDFINWAKNHGIPVGPGRGSGAGSIVAYALRITDLDPIPYGLLFERFLNPERVSMPDFDVDFCMDRRDEVIRYVREKYGNDSVGQIATFHLLKSRSVVRDVGRVMKMTPQDAGRIASLVPEPVQGKSVSIPKALEQEARLKAIYDEDAHVHTLLDTAMTLEDLTRHAGMHAAGVVISKGALWDHVPVFCPEPGTFVTQFHKDDVESAGLVKFDFLGLKTLTVIDIATRLIDKRPDRTEPFRIDRIPLEDKATFGLLQSGETTNVFQLESSGMQSLFKQLKPDCFEDIIAAVALYRPGPLGSGMVEDFVQRKHGRVKVEYPHRCLERILKETYGVIVYQEQVMQAAREMAGYTLGGADLLRRAMGKKKAEEMAKQKQRFIEGAVAKSYAAEDAERVFTLIDYFAGYGFNKSHSAAYALLTYQTAYLKAHYPVEFVCATLTADKDKIDKVVRTVAEARSMSIVVLPPDVNESEIDFTVVYAPEDPADFKAKLEITRPIAVGGKLRDPMSPKIRFGLGAVKGIGSAALEAIFEARAGITTTTSSGGLAAPVPAPAPAPSAAGEPPPATKQPFTDLHDFAARVDVRRVNKAVVEALVQCGAFDTVLKKTSTTRAQAFAAIDQALERGRKISADRESGQTDLFGLLAPAEAAAVNRTRPADLSVEPWDVREILAREKSSLGFYVSGHPLDRYASEIKRFCNATTVDLSSKSEGAKVVIGGSVEGWRERPTKTGQKIAFFSLEDAVGRVEVIVRPRLLDSVRDVLLSGEPVLVSGIVQFERDRGQGALGVDEEGFELPPQAKIVLEEVAPLAESLRARTKSVRIKLPVDRAERSKLVALRETLSAHPGACPVTIELTTQERWSVVLTVAGMAVEPSEKLMSALERVFGEKVCELR